MRQLLPVALLFLAGCRGGNDLMPLEVGKRFSYNVSTNFNSYTAEVKVIRRSAVEGLDGFVLHGPTGESFLAWKGDTLIGERFANTRFTPAIPLVVESDKRVRRTWSGKVQGAWGQFDGVATLNQAPSNEIVGGRKVKVVKSELTIDNPKGKSIRLRTLFQPGAGIVAQHQWVGGDLVVGLDWLSGS